VRKLFFTSLKKRRRKIEKVQSGGDVSSTSKNSQSLKNSFKALQDASFGLLSRLWVCTLKNSFPILCFQVLYGNPVGGLSLSANLALILEDDI